MVSFVAPGLIVDELEDVDERERSSSSSALVDERSEPGALLDRSLLEVVLLDVELLGDSLVIVSPRLNRVRSVRSRSAPDEESSDDASSDDASMLVSVLVLISGLDGD